MKYELITWPDDKRWALWEIKEDYSEWRILECSGYDDIRHAVSNRWQKYNDKKSSLCDVTIPTKKDIFLLCL